MWFGNILNKEGTFRHEIRAKNCTRLKLSLFKAQIKMQADKRKAKFATITDVAEIKESAALVNLTKMT